MKTLKLKLKLKKKNNNKKMKKLHLKLNKCKKKHFADITFKKATQNKQTLILSHLI